jgi:hypothetical protein
LDAEKMLKHYKDGEFLEANIAFHDVGYRTALMLMIPMWTMIINALSQGRNPTPTEEGEENLEDFQMDQLPQWVFNRFTTYDGAKDMFFTMFGDNTPVLRSLIWAGKTERPTSIPLLTAGDHMKSSVVVGNKVFLNMINDEMNFAEAWEMVEEKDRKSIMYSVGILSGGLPVNAYYKWKKILSDEDGEFAAIEEVPLVAIGTTIEVLDRIIEKFGGEKKAETDEEAFERALKRARDKIQEDAVSEKTKEDFAGIVDFSKSLKEQLTIKIDTEDPLTDEDYEIIKQAESGGKWNAKSASGARGMYQFIESTWVRLMNTPEGKKAGLTKKGWTSKNTDQQEAAMRVLTKLNARSLKRYNIPIDIESLYFAHHFGTSRAPEVYKKSNSTKLRSDFFTSAEANSNFYTKQHKNRPKKPKTVGELKQYIRDALARGERRALKLDEAEGPVL